MSIFALGDTHLSLSCDKPMDIFGGWSDYVDRLKNNWQHLVTPDDTVVINGDISWGMSLEESKADFEFLNSLNGNKIIIKGNHDYWWTTATKAKKLFADNNYKLELIDGIDGEITIYEQGKFYDLCAGPHVEKVSQIQHFKLLSVAGAYWRGDVKNKMLTRIYGTSWWSKEELDKHLSLFLELNIKANNLLNELKKTGCKNTLDEIERGFRIGKT